MNTQFKESFNKDLRRIRDKDLLNRTKAVILSVEQAKGLGDIPNLERLKGWSKYYRIRVGDYRVGLAVEGDVVTFVRFLHRKDIYRYFPWTCASANARTTTTAGQRAIGRYLRFARHCVVLWRLATRLSKSEESSQWQHDKS